MFPKILRKTFHEILGVIHINQSIFSVLISCSAKSKLFLFLNVVFFFLKTCTKIHYNISLDRFSRWIPQTHVRVVHGINHSYRNIDYWIRNNPNYTLCLLFQKLVPIIWQVGKKTIEEHYGINLYWLNFILRALIRKMAW